MNKLLDYKIIQSENFYTAEWPGGTTTELFIFPPEANYRQRNFDFRLSTATVVKPKSEFTSLPGISRKIMVLDGEIIISHENHYSRKLKKFEVDAFEGDWKTISVGKCTDFNLMTRGKTRGELYAFSLNKNQSVDFVLRGLCDWLFIYFYSGKVTLEQDAETITLKNGDLLFLKKPGKAKLLLEGLEESELVVSEIIFPFSKI